MKTRIIQLEVFDEIPKKKKFIAYYYCNGWDFSLGISICWHLPNIEIHIPTGFIRIGWSRDWGPDYGDLAGNKVLYRSFGWTNENSK